MSPDTKQGWWRLREGVDNKDIEEVELTGCPGKGEGRAQMAASSMTRLLEGPSCHCPCHHDEESYILLPCGEAPRAVEGVELLSQR